MGHAKFSPSASFRWLNCTASVDMESGRKDEAGGAAARGTLYHAVAEQALRHLTTPVGYPTTGPTEKDIERAVKLGYRAVAEDPLKFCSDEGWTKTALKKLISYDDAEPLVLSYVRDVVRGWWPAIRSGDFGIEARADASFIGGEVWGTADFWALDHDGVLLVLDLKTGAVPVDPDQNSQLIIYALGIIAGLKPEQRDRVNGVCLGIHQLGELKLWVASLEELHHWELDIRRAVEAARLGGELRAGAWCRYCKAKLDCGAFADRGVEQAQSDFGAIETVAPLDDDGEIRTLNNMPAELVADVLDKFAFIEMWVKAALPVLAERVYNGEIEIPGYKVIRGRKNKAWKDPNEAEEILRSNHGDDIYKQVLRTPTQLLKDLGEDALRDLWEVPEGELKLVTEATRGKAVSAADAEFTTED